MSERDALSIELALDRLDARFHRAVTEYMLGRWLDRARGAVAPLPALLVDPPVRARLAEWRQCDGVLGRRAQMLWRWFVRAEVESHPDVVAAFRARDMSRLIRARNRAAGPDGYYAHAMALEPVPASLRWEHRSPRYGADADDTAATAKPTLDIRDQPGPVGGWTFPVDPPGDIRVFVFGPPGPERERVLAHERGHAAYAAGLDPGLPFSLRRPPARCLDEAVAMRFEATAGVPATVTDAQVDAERHAYDSEPDGLEWRPQWAADPVSLPSYRAAADIARALAHVPLAQLPARIFRHGASSTVSKLLADAAIPD